MASDLHTDQRRRAEDIQLRPGIDAWLRRGLADQYAAVLDEPLPAGLLDLLPRERDA